MSVAGSGDVALVWGDVQAEAYSGLLGGWFPYSDSQSILGGAASGEIALFWSGATAYSFSANTGTRSQVQLQGTSAVNEGPLVPSMFGVGANPTREALRFTPRDEADWQLRVVDASGRLLRSFTVPGGEESRWDLRDQEGRALRAGSYRLEARSGQRLETQRVVIAH